MLIMCAEVIVTFALSASATWIILWGLKQWIS